MQYSLDEIQIDKIISVEMIPIEETLEQKKHREEIENNGLCQFRYDMIDAYENGVQKHPQKDLIDRGYKIIHAEPVPIADCWLFTVEKFIEPLPNYCTVTHYDLELYRR